MGQARVKVVYFAQARELAGIKEDDFVLTPPASVKNLFSLVLKVHPEIAEIAVIIRALVNGRLAADDAELKDGDRVAIVPPAAGG
jgi:molybdopterin synthase sulfur carrier subunit